MHKDGELLELDLPSAPPEPWQAPPELLAALGGSPVETLCSTYGVVVLESEAAVAALTPDMEALERADPQGTVVTAPGTDDGIDFVSRFFGPAVGVPEDPVTGSAHCVTTPYWAGRLGRTELHARQISRRGGELRCRLHRDRVRLAGRARLYLEGIAIP